MPGDPSDAVVWEELTARTREESTLNSTFLAFLVLAVLLRRTPSLVPGMR